MERKTLDNFVLAETIEIRLEGIDDNNVDFDAYVAYLNSLKSIIHSTAESLLVNRSEYRLIINQSRPGSFISDINIYAAHIADYVTIGVFIVGLFELRKNSTCKGIKKVVHTLEGVEVIHNDDTSTYLPPSMFETYLNNPDIENSMSDSSKKSKNVVTKVEITVNNEKLTYDEQDIVSTSVKLSKSEFIKNETTLSGTTWLQVKTPVLIGRSQWLLVLSDGNTIKAKITDEDFLKKFDDDQIEFTKHFEMEVDFKAIPTKKTGMYKYEITKVIQYKRKKEIAKIQELEL